MFNIKHSSTVTSEAFSVISKLKKPDTGFEGITLVFYKLDKKLSETVFDQFVQHAKQLKAFSMYGYDDLPETDEPNVLELASRILEEQEEPVIQKLDLARLSSKSSEEPTEEDKRLINAVVRSGIT